MDLFKNKNKDLETKVKEDSEDKEVLEAVTYQMASKELVPRISEHTALYNGKAIELYFEAKDFFVGDHSSLLFPILFLDKSLFRECVCVIGTSHIKDNLFKTTLVNFFPQTLKVLKGKSLGQLVILDDALIK